MQAISKRELQLFAFVGALQSFSGLYWVSRVIWFLFAQACHRHLDSVLAVLQSAYEQYKQWISK